MSRVLILGIDGGTWEMIDDLVRDGKLPTIGTLMRRGSRAPLRSTVQPVTPAAWSSFMTGKNPGRHGVYDFMSRVSGSYHFRLNNSRSLGEETLWSYLSRRGRRVIVLNVPFTYPPERVNGILIAGFDAPRQHPSISSPESVYQELARVFGTYRMDWTFPKGERYDLAAYRKNVLDTIAFRLESARYVMARYPWDLFMLALNSIDHVQHLFWGGTTEEQALIREAYETVDHGLGVVLDQLNGDVTTIVMSDHGAGKVRRIVYLDNWLAHEGYLSRTPGRFVGSVSRSLLNAAKRVAPVSLRKALRYHFPGVRDELETMAKFRSVDLARTRAFSVGTYGNVYIHRTGEWPNGVVREGEDYERVRDEVAGKLNELRDPETGERLIERVFTRQELYWGDRVAGAPDLVIQWRDYGYFTRAGIDTGSAMFGDRLSIQASGYLHRGTHRLDGIFIAAGPGLREGVELDKAHICDLFGTIVHALGEPIPADLDGRLLLELFEPAGRLPTYDTVTQGRKAAGQPAEDAAHFDEETVKERLRNLGYID